MYARKASTLRQWELPRPVNLMSVFNEVDGSHPPASIVPRIALGPAVMEPRQQAGKHERTGPLCIDLKSTLAIREPSAHEHARTLETADALFL